MIACKSEIQKSTVFPCISSRKQKKTTLSKTREKTLNNPPKNTPALTWRVRGLYGADRATAERRRREAGRRRPEAPAPRERRCPQSHRDAGVGPAQCPPHFSEGPAQLTDSSGGTTPQSRVWGQEGTEQGAGGEARQSRPRGGSWTARRARRGPRSRLDPRVTGERVQVSRAMAVKRAD